MIQMQDNYHIRIDSPTDLIILNNLDFSEIHEKYNINKWKIRIEENLSFEKLNQASNKYFVDKNFYMAIRTYTKALNLTKQKPDIAKPAEIKKVFNNRAATNLKLEKWYQAYQDTLSSLQIDDNSDKSQNEKAYFRQGKALYSMRQFDDALKSFNKCLEINPNQKEAQTEVEKCNQRIHESKTGQYNMKQIIHDSKVKKELRLDLADYMSNDIEIVEVRPNCKGIVAKNDIKKNTLIMASKAASIAYSKECSKDLILSLNMFNKRMMTTTQCQNLTLLTQKVQNDPHMSREIYKLYAGSDFDRNQTINECIVEVSRIEAIQTFNSFKGQLYSFSVTEILKDNNNNSYDDPRFDLNEEDNTGLWILPSYFNHACVPNTDRLFFSDFMTVYTSKSDRRNYLNFIQ
jgi:tetratricopeptide (TPR) repeat protein